MSGIVRVQGFSELDHALGALPKSTAKTVLRRTAIKAAEPIRAAAEANAPRDTGELASHIVTSTKVKNTVGNAEYSMAMRLGMGKSVARAALIDARRNDPGKSFFQLYIGPTKAKTKKDAIKRIVQEFGSVNQPGQPYMRPAWDAHKSDALAIIKAELGKEIIAAAKRLGRSKRASVDARNGAAFAALLAHEAGY